MCVTSQNRRRQTVADLVPDAPFAYAGQVRKSHLYVRPPREPTLTPPGPQTTRIYHPNVTDDGAICMGVLKSEAWKPSTKIEQSGLFLQLFFADTRGLT